MHHIYYCIVPWESYDKFCVAVLICPNANAVYYSACK